MNVIKLLIPLASLFLFSASSKAPAIINNFRYNSDEFSRQYKLNRKEWDAAFNFLQNTDLKSLPVGEWQQLTEKTKGRTQKVLTAENRGFEVHHRTVDVFYVVEGQDKVGVSATDKLLDCTKAYQEKSDVELYARSMDPEYVILEKGQGIILFPSDGHSPNLCISKPDSLYLCVVKVPYITE